MIDIQCKDGKYIIDARIHSEIDTNDIDKTINSYSVSTFEKFNDIKRTLKLMQRKNPKAKVAYGTTVRSCGLSAHTKNKEKR